MTATLSSVQRRRQPLVQALLLCGLLAATGCSAAWPGLAFADTRLELEAVRSSERRPVVLLHGLGRSERAMWEMKQHFIDAGFAAHSIGYDSRRQSIEEIVTEVDEALVECCAARREINFVTHSLGGIVLRAWAEEGGKGRIGRAVMLSPPNHGSAIVDSLGRLSTALGPTGEELGTHDDSTPNRLNAIGPVEFELGVIAGDRSMNPIGSWILDGPDDGTVSVESARVEGMRDFLVMPFTHVGMRSDADVALQAVRFVETGAFARDFESADSAVADEAAGRADKFEGTAE